MSEKRGRKPGLHYYKDEYCEQAYRLCLLGLTDKELAVFFDVSDNAIITWKNKNKKFADALKLGRCVSDANVAVALYKRAIGYDYEEEQAFCTNKGIVKTVVTKHLPGDVKAQAIWLMNRQHKRWTLTGQAQKQQEEEKEQARIELESSRSDLSNDPQQASREYIDFIKQSTFIKRLK